MNRFSPRLTNVPVCPAGSNDLVEALGYPSIVIVDIGLSFISLFFALWTAWWYNSVTIYDVKVRQPSISNTLWICYFLAVCCRAVTDSILFGLSGKPTSVPATATSPRDTLLTLLSLGFCGVTTLFLTLALDHQRRYRSSFAHTDPETKTVNPTSTTIASVSITSFKTTPLKSKSRPTSGRISGFLSQATFNADDHSVTSSTQTHEQSLPEDKKTKTDEEAPFLINETEQGHNSGEEQAGGIETPSILLLLLYLLAIYAEFTMSKPATPLEPTFWAVFLGLWSLQHVPIVILLIIIVVNHKQTVTATATAKLILTIGVLIYVVNDIPLTIWSGTLVDRKCIIGSFASVLDLIHVFFLIAQVLFFVFLRMEYHRNEEDCKWRIVSQKGNGFDFRDFQ